MSEIRYTSDHEWVRRDQDGALTIGITNHAQEALGDLVFVELPAEGRAVQAEEACAVVESVKAASDVLAPLAGSVTQVNEAVVTDPSLVNREAEGAAWLFRLTPDDPKAFDALMDAAAYAAFAGDSE